MIVGVTKQRSADETEHISYGRNDKIGGCVYCGNASIKPEYFRDDSARREFRATGMCQDCQDESSGE